MSRLPHCMKASEQSGPETAIFSQMITPMNLEANEYQATNEIGENESHQSGFSNQRKSGHGETIASHELDQSPHDPSASFPLMKLPAELRLMVCEYAMLHERELVWRWKSEVIWKSIGCFIPVHSNYTDHVGPNLITRLSVSRQLRQGTMHLWEKFAILHFDGRDDVPGPSSRPFHPRDGGNLDLAIMGCRFFVSHARTKNMSRVPQIIIDAAYYFNCNDLCAERLLKVGHDGRFSHIRVVLHRGADSWRFWEHEAWRYLKYVRGVVRRVNAMDTSVARRFKVFPFHLGLEKRMSRPVQEGWLAVKQVEELKDFIHNGL